MALALADSIGSGEWDINDQARKYVAWWRTGAFSVNGRCFDIGITTRNALHRFEQHGDANSSGDSSAQSSGNGSIMRLAPVPIRYTHHFPDQIEELSRLAADSSLPTHASAQCLSACRYMALILCGLMHGLDRDDILSPGWPPLATLRSIAPLHPEIDAVADGSFRRAQPPRIKGSGYVVQSLEAAMWAFHDAQNFREAVLRAVNLGDDADTTGAVCGQLAGACWGEDGIPSEWRSGVAQMSMIEKALDGLLAPADGVPSEPVANLAELPAQSRRIAIQLAEPDARPPTRSSYWVVPGKLLAGSFPGDRDPTRGLPKVKAVLAVGIRTIINLMEEGETNHEHEPFAPYKDLVRELDADVVCIRNPIRDQSTPTPDQLHDILDTIDNAIEQGRAVYVHCWGGVGRTGTVIGCWLLRHGLAIPDDVLAVLQRLRRQDQSQGRRLSPETEGQRDFVRRWKQYDRIQ
jgi:ADP-ribosylglycohydrolase